MDQSEVGCRVRKTGMDDKMARARRRVWLRSAAATGGWRNGAACGLLVLDNPAAIGFAAALAFGLTALPRGLGAMLPWLALGLVSSCLRGVFAMLAARVGAQAAKRAKTYLRRRIVAATFALPVSARPATGALMTAAVDGVEALDGYVARFLPARSAVGGALLVLVAVALASPVAAAILAITTVPFVAMMVLAGGAAADEAGRQFVALGRLGALFADRIRMLPLVLTFQAEAIETARLEAAAEELRLRMMGVLRIAFLSSAGLEFFAAMSVALVAVYAGFNLLGLLPALMPERLDLGRAFFVLALAPEFYAPLRRLAATYHDQQAAQAAADDLMKLEAAAVPAAAAPRLRNAPCVRFDHVTVQYPGEDRPVLDNFALTLEAGEIVALLGPSGAGKTTVLNLLLGLAPLTQGQVTLDGASLGTLGTIVGSVAWMGQAPMLIPGSIASNIALSRQDATPQELLAVAEQSGLGPLLASRPEGIDAPMDERGGGLSGGERQRVALARALLKSAPLLLLDEPTAHVDAATEVALVAAIARGARGRTTLIATHSPRLAAIADRIVHLESA